MFRASQFRENVQNTSYWFHKCLYNVEPRLLTCWVHAPQLAMSPISSRFAFNLLIHSIETLKAQSWCSLSELPSYESNEMNPASKLGLVEHQWVVKRINRITLWDFLPHRRVSRLLPTLWWLWVRHAFP